MAFFSVISTARFFASMAFASESTSAEIISRDKPALLTNQCQVSLTKTARSSQRERIGLQSRRNVNTGYPSACHEAANTAG